MKLNVDEVVFEQHPLRPVNSARVDFYKKELEHGREVAPILVDENNMLVDGVHRLVAHQLLGQKTIAAERHIPTPLDLPHNKAIADTISALAKASLANVKFVDRRVASSVHCELANKKNQLRLQEEDQTKDEQTIVKITGKLVSLRALNKKYRSLLDKSPHYAGLVDETSLKISGLESDLAFWKKDLDRVTRIVDSLKKLLKEFLAQTPGKGFPTNGEMLVADDELKKLEREAANEMNAASF
jgi:hypothetical protein